MCDLYGLISRAHYYTLQSTLHTWDPYSKPFTTFFPYIYRWSMIKFDSRHLISGSTMIIRQQTIYHHREVPRSVNWIVCYWGASLMAHQLLSTDHHLHHAKDTDNFRLLVQWMYVSKNPKWPITFTVLGDVLMSHASLASWTSRFLFMGQATWAQL